jgi:PhnB protein
MSRQPVPSGYHSLTPYLIVRDAASALGFYREALGAVERLCLKGPSGKVTHAEVQVGDSIFMLADEYPEMGFVGPQTYGGSPVSLLLYVEDVDARFAQAVASGARELRPVRDQFYGDRTGMLQDPFGHVWTIATHLEDLSPEEIDRRHAAETGQAPDSSK